MTTHTLLIVLLMISCRLGAQSNFWNSPHAYLGQQPPSDTPKVFAPGMLASDSGIALDRVAFSADGREFYYCYALHWFDSKGASIKYFKYTDGQWKGPMVLTDGYYAPAFSVDDQRLYFIGGGKPGTVMQSARTATGWGKETIFLKRHYGVYDFMPTSSGNLYAASNINGDINNFSCYDFSLLPGSDEDTVAQTLGTPLNTPGFDGDFFVARDESFIVISAKETKDFQSELHISFRRPDHSWTAPRSLGPLINNGAAHRWGQYVTPDNRYLFFTQGTSEQDCHIYWVRFDTLLRQLRP